MMRPALLLAALFVLAACQPAGPKDERTVLRFSIASTENAAAQLREWRPFLDEMEKGTGYRIEPYFASNYTGLVEAMRFKQIDLGWFTNQSGMEAVRRSGGEVFARSKKPDGPDGYQSVIIVKKGSGVTLERLLKCDRSLDFGMGDAKSTSGTLAPMTYLFAPRGIDPARCFKTVRAANHEANIMAVANGLLAAATNNTASMDRFAWSTPGPGHKQILDRLETVWTSPTIPEDPMVWRKDLDPAVKRKVADFMFSYGTGEGAEAERQRAILARIETGPFQRADNTHLWPVREMEAQGKILQARSRGDKAGEAEGQAELAAIAAERAAAR